MFILKSGAFALGHYEINSLSLPGLFQKSNYILFNVAFLYLKVSNGLIFVVCFKKVNL